MTNEPLLAADYRLLLSLLNHAIVAPDQRARIEKWLASQGDTAQTVEDCAVKLCSPAPKVSGEGWRSYKREKISYWNFGF